MLLVFCTDLSDPALTRAEAAGQRKPTSALAGPKGGGEERRPSLASVASEVK